MCLASWNVYQLSRREDVINCVYLSSLYEKWHEQQHMRGGTNNIYSQSVLLETSTICY
jgi:hypothetical protein